MMQTVALRGKIPYGKRMPPVPIGHLLRRMPDLVRQCISTAFQRRSGPRGRPPEWLVAASDIRLIDIGGADRTVVRFDAPRLGDVASAVYQQGELFPSRPDPNDTGFDLLGDVLREVTARNEDSDRFDPHLLQNLKRFSHVINGHFQEMLVSGRRYSIRSPAVMDRETLSAAASLYLKTPPPRRARIVGKLDAVRISTQTFSLRLDDGHEVRGVLSDGQLDPLLDLFASQQRVTVRGDAVFRPSGQLLLIDAHDIGPAVGESAVWSRTPQPAAGRMDVQALRRRQGPRSGLAAIVGRWPGDETDEQVEAALGALS
jgi:hypothetical protein